MFRISKYLLLVGIPIIICLVILLSWMYRLIASSDIERQSEASNIILTKTIANVLWPQISGFMKVANELQPKNLNYHDGGNPLAFEVINMMLEEPLYDLLAGTNVLRVKLFTVSGITVFSTDKSIVGRKRFDYPPIVNARKGLVTTHVEYKKSFQALDGEMLHNRFVISSYLPVKNTATGEVEGIFEIYTDTTTIYEQINQSQIKFAFALASIFFVFYFIIYLILRHLNRANIKNIELAAIARDSAKDASAAKSKFLANMSHELRTPLNAIIGYSEMMMEDATTDGSDHAVQDLQKIQSSGLHLLQLVDQILDLSKIEAGQMSLFMEDIDLPILLDDVTSVVMPLVEKKNNRLVIECDENIAIVHTDVTKLRQVLVNLISNAAKFTENGILELKIMRANAWLLFSVSDTGIGMTEEQMALLFKPFAQANESISRKFGGTGLGLAICKQFCELMGGGISVHSEPGRGSTFRVKIPVQPQTSSSFGDRLEQLSVA